MLTLLPGRFFKGNLREIIDEGDSEKLELLLSGDNPQRLLSETYGGNANEGAEEHGLFQKTPPLLHAALRGRKDAVSVLLGALLVNCVRACFCLGF